MNDIVVAIGLLLVIEGLVYALAPFAVRTMAAKLPELSDQSLRGFGAAAVAVGVFLVWLVRG
jgi:uncharacterized protein YjeT (DUF2065 family)